MNTEAKMNGSYQKRMLNVLIYIQNNLDRTLSLEELSEVAYFSPYHFHRIFSALKGESVKSYVRRLRLERAVSDLLYSKLSITQIAARAGYDSQQSFHRAFQKAFQIPPKAFKTLGKEKFAKRLEEQSEEFANNLSTKKTNDSFTVKIVTLEPMQVAFVRTTGEYGFENAEKAWQKLLAEFGLTHILSNKTWKINIPYDIPDITPTEKIRLDACITLEGKEDFKPQKEIGVQTIHGGEYAVITHHGEIEKMDMTYLYLFGVWLPQSGREPADHPSFMCHRKLPYYTPKKSLLTDIYLPLK